MKDISKIVADVESTLAPYFKEIEETAYINQEKVLNAFHHVKATKVIYKDQQDTGMMTLDVII